MDDYCLASVSDSSSSSELLSSSEELKVSSGIEYNSNLGLFGSLKNNISFFKGKGSAIYL